MGKKWLVAVGLGLVLTLVAGTTALAQSPTPPTPNVAPAQGTNPNALGGAGIFRVGITGWKVFDAAAEALKLTPAQFFEKLHAGGTVAEIAQAQGVPLKDVLQAVRAAVPGWKRPAHLVWPAGGWNVFDAVAGALELTPDQLFEQLHGGKTVAEIAQAQGVDIQVVRDAARQARQEQARAAIQKALDEGKITQDQADWMLKGLENGWSWPPRGGELQGRSP